MRIFSHRFNKTNSTKIYVFEAITKEEKTKIKELLISGLKWGDRVEFRGLKNCCPIFPTLIFQYQDFFWEVYGGNPEDDRACFAFFEELKERGGEGATMFFYDNDPTFSNGKCRLRFVF